MSLVCGFSPQGRVWWEFYPIFGQRLWARGCAWAQQWHEDVRYCNHQWLFNPVQPLLVQCTSYSLRFLDFAQQWSSFSFGFCHCDFQQCACDSHFFVLSITGFCSQGHPSAPLCWLVVVLQWICNFTFSLTCTHLTVLTWILLLWDVVPQP